MARNSRTAATVTVLGAVALAVGIYSPAIAHDGLVSSSPEPGSTVSTELTGVVLDFSQDFLDLAGATSAYAIEVSGPDARFYNTGCLQLEPSRISIGTELGASGQYTVAWQIVSSDGHPTSDSFDFVYEKPADVVASAGSVEGDTCTPRPDGGAAPAAPPIQSPPISPSPTALAAEQSTVTLAIPLIVGAVGIALLSVIAAVLIIRLRRAN